MNVCTICGLEKQDSEFHVEPRIPKGIAAACRLCIKEKRKGRHASGKSYKRDPNKERARGRVRDAIRHGKMVKPTVCECCKTETPAHLLDGHHHDYDKPLEVRWLCRSCHGLESFGVNHAK